MWFMNRLINPLVHLILRSPLHGLLSGSIVLLTYQGRKSSKHYTLPVQYVRVGDTLIIVPGAAANKTWWRNRRGGAPVRLRVGTHDLEANAEVLSGDADRGAIISALNSYWQRFPASAHLHHVGRARDGGFDPTALGTAASRVVIVRATLVPVAAKRRST
jgi:deazaflavin-dependent oxidoreductase (nitroreductase family)